ncbi:uncharacterized protein B0H64DRAFT_407992 [Chaetomium fimeti]|uniref:Cupin domain-containing protein n=1 Tax=Chaetomium fimeti TaxID=1854472 RepID=A0AAE0H8H0_9PEZI|nr:hypothetical protein B0H64DRAFT_407992 [Chaetomium fimeti]
MTDWEMVPGRISVGSGADTENIAFSYSYLAEDRPGPVADGVKFQVVEVPGGGSMRWAAVGMGMRLCSVASGTVRVWLSEQDQFAIGPNGMWKVRPGVACTVLNPSPVAAVLHVTTFGEHAV